jgi:hypothetical protein
VFSPDAFNFQSEYMVMIIRDRIIVFSAEDLLLSQKSIHPLPVKLPVKYLAPRA